MEKEELRTYIMANLGNTAWRNATGGAPLDVEHCGENLWSLWYNPEKLSVFSISVKEDASLDEWQKLKNDLELAFDASVENLRKFS